MANSSQTQKKAKMNIVFLTISQIIAFAFGLIMPRITMVGYGSEVNGLINSVNQIISYFSLFEAGIQAVAKKSLYKTILYEDKTESNEILSAVNVNYKRIGRLYFLCILSLSIIYPFIVSCESLGFLSIFLIIFFSGIGNVISFFYQAKYQMLLNVDGKSYILTIFSTIISLLNHLVRIILLINAVKIELVIISAFAISLLQVLFVWWYIKHNYTWINVHEKPNFDCLKQSKYAFVHQLSGQIFAHIDVLLLTFFCDLKIVSVYSIYKMLVYYIRTVIVIPLDSITFALGQMFNRDKDLYIKSLDTFEMLFSLSINALYTITLFLLIPFIKIYTRGISDTNYIFAFLPLLFVLGEVLNLVRGPMAGTINFAGHFKETMWRSVLETVLNLVCSVIFVVKFGIYGVLIGTVAALLYRTTDIIIYANTKILNRSPIKTLSFYLFGFLLMISSNALLKYLFNILKIEINSYISFFIFAIPVTIAIVLVFSTLYMLVFKNERKMIINYIHNRFKK